MTRNGKIARLPLEIRNQVNTRLRNGQIGKKILLWLNGLKEVRTVLHAHFGGADISEQNLSEWKNGGYEDWLRLQDVMELHSTVAEESDQLKALAKDDGFSDRFTLLLGLQLARTARELIEKETDPERRWDRLCKIHHEFSRMRRDDHRAITTSIQQARWRRETALDDDPDLQEAMDQVLHPPKVAPSAQPYLDQLHQTFEHVLRENLALKLKYGVDDDEDLGEEDDPAPDPTPSTQANRLVSTNSSSIQANQTRSNSIPSSSSQASEAGNTRPEPLASPTHLHPGISQPDPTKSNQIRPSVPLAPGSQPTGV